jgi:hypothetical protein
MHIEDKDTDIDTADVLAQKAVFLFSTNEQISRKSILMMMQVTRAEMIDQILCRVPYP